MNKLWKVFTVVVIAVLAAVLLGTQAVQALRDFAAPEPLPYGLTMQDTMSSIEDKLGQPVEVHAPQAGWSPGLPDDGGSPDRFHYWAIYRRFGLTVVYDSPSLQDKNARVIAIIRHK